MLRLQGSGAAAAPGPESHQLHLLRWTWLSWIPTGFNHARGPKATTTARPRRRRVHIKFHQTTPRQRALTSASHSKPPGVDFFLFFLFNLLPLSLQPRHKSQPSKMLNGVKENATKLIGDTDGPSGFVQTQGQGGTFPSQHNPAFVQEPSPRLETCGQ